MSQNRIGNPDPAYEGPIIPGYTKISNHGNATSEAEAIEMGSKWLDIAASDVIAVRFQPTNTRYWKWASYADEKHSGKVAIKVESVRLLLESLLRGGDVQT